MTTFSPAVRRRLSANLKLPEHARKPVIRLVNRDLTHAFLISERKNGRYFGLFLSRICAALGYLSPEELRDMEIDNSFQAKKPLRAYYEQAQMKGFIGVE